MLLYLRAQCSSVQEWVEKFPAAVVQLRRSVLAADAQAYRRHTKVHASWPWQIAVIADARIPYSERLAVAERFLDETCPHCLDQYFGLRLRQLFPTLTARELVTDRFWIHAIGEWARTVDIHLAKVECRHARNRAQADKKTALTTFVSRYVVREANHIRRLRKDMWQLLLTPEPEPHPDANRHPQLQGQFMEKVNAVKRYHTPFEVYLKYHYLQNSLNNVKKVHVSIVNVEARLAWATLPDADAKRFEVIAEMTRHIAAENNKRKRASSSGNMMTIADGTPIQQPRRHMARADLNNLNEWIVTPSIGLPIMGDELWFDIPEVIAVNTPIISESLYNTVVSQTPGKGAAVEKNFKWLVGFMGTGILKGHNAFPKTVKYSKQCTSLCKSRTSAEHVHFAKVFLARLDGYRVSLCKPVEVPERDILFVFEVMPHHGSFEAEAAYFYKLSACLGGCAGNPPSFLFHVLERVGDVSHGLRTYAGMLLRLTYAQHVRSRSLI